MVIGELFVEKLIVASPDPLVAATLPLLMPTTCTGLPESGRTKKCGHSMVMVAAVSRQTAFDVEVSPAVLPSPKSTSALPYSDQSSSSLYPNMSVVSVMRTWLGPAHLGSQLKWS